MKKSNEEVMSVTLPIAIKYESRVADHLRAAQRYYQTTFFYIGDKIVGILLLLFGVYSIVTARVDWWTILIIALAPCEWFNLPGYALDNHRLYC